MKIKELLTDESKWTKNTLARNAVGEEELAHSEFAVSWCLVGAAVKCYSFGAGDVLNKIRDYIKSPVVDFNNNPQTTFADIRKLVEELDI